MAAAEPYLQQARRPWRLVPWLPGLLVATGLVDSYAVNGLVFVVVALGLPTPAILRRFAGGAVAVAVTGNWGTSATLLWATPEQATANALQFRTVVVGMLVVEALQHCWSARQHRRLPDGS